MLENKANLDKVPAKTGVDVSLSPNNTLFLFKVTFDAESLRKGVHRDARSHP